MDAWLAKTQGGTTPPSSTQPGPPGSGSGSQGNVNSNPADDWIGSSQDTSVYYGKLPHSQGNTNVNVSNPSGGNYQGPSVNNNNNNNNNNQTGSGATGGTGSASGAVGSGITNLAGITAAQRFLGKRQPGLEGLVQDNLEDYGLTSDRFITNTENAESGNLNTDNSSVVNDLKNKVDGWKQKIDDWKEVEIGNNTLSLEGSLNNPKLQIERPIFWGGTGTANVDTQGNWGLNATWPLGGNKAKGGPVGIMSLPEGYAAGGPVGVDPSDWRIIQQIIAAGGNPEDYVNYANGGDVDSEGTSYIDPTADNYFLRQFGQYLKRFMPNYDPESDEWRHKRNREKQKEQGYENGGEVHNPYMGPQAQSRPPTPEEEKPFGGTRENIMDHIEAFDNAPHHMEEPMVGMYGERVPLTLARRVQKYMEGLDPVKRDMIQETLNMFQMKKRMEEMEELNENSGFFGPIPNEYEA